MKYSCLSSSKSGREQFLSECAVNDEELANINTAYKFAKYAHKNQCRDGGGRYFEHPRAVARIIMHELGLKDNWKLIVTALLHDTLEDSFLLDKRLLQTIFGEEVALWIELLTKEDGIDYFARFFEYNIWEVLVAKLADRLHNVRTLHECDIRKQEKCREETRRLYIPLAEKLASIIPQEHVALAHYLKSELKRRVNQESGVPQ